ncbi:hypothetical protein, partial [Streptococcus oralis]
TLEGLGNDIFKKFLNWLKKGNGKNENEFLKSLPKEYIDLHLEVVTIVVSWTCAPEKSII